MFGECSVGVAQAAEIDDALEASRFGGTAKFRAARYIALLEVVSARHAVDHVERHLHVPQSGWQRLVAQAIARNDLHPAEPGTSFQPGWIARQAADSKPGLQQTRHEPPADVAARAGDENCSGRCHDVR